MRALCEKFQKNLDIPVKLTLPAEIPDIPAELAICLFRVAQECLQNIAKHAEAAEVSVVLERRSGELHLRISDTVAVFHCRARAQSRPRAPEYQRERVSRVPQG